MLRPEERELIEARLGRKPTRAELALFEVLWSEHCSYKTSRKYLKLLPTRAPWVLVGPGENAGAVAYKGKALVFKVESHNHPSAVEPFHGAATGVGGIIRDILSMGARPTALLDSLRFGPPDNPKAARLLDGVVRGISFYGNSVGVPTVAGEAAFAECYLDNPLVNVMCVGVCEATGLMDSKLKRPGDPLLLVGATTGRDGIGGAAFASEDLTGDLRAKRPAVQIGDPFMEKLLIEATLEALATGAVVALQDLGAGGLGGVGEMAAKGGLGVRLHLDRVPLREPLEPWEILVSESQERAVLEVGPEEVDKIIDIYKHWGLRAVVVGEVTAERRLVALHEGKEVASVPVELLASAPRRELPEREPAYLRELWQREVLVPGVGKGLLLRLLAHPDIADKAWIYSQYDHMVGTDTVVLPGEAGGALLRIKGEDWAYAVTIDGQARWVYLHPYVGSQHVVLEALRNLVAIGARPLGITDCLNFPNPEIPENLWVFARSVEGVARAAGQVGVPVVSGNVSLYNQSEERAIWPTPIVGAVGVLEPVKPKRCVGRPEDALVLLGKPGGLAGSLAQALLGELAGLPQEPDYRLERLLWEVVWSAGELLTGATDLSDGGLLVAVAEMCLASGVGADLHEGDPSVLLGEMAQAILVSTPNPDGVLALARARGLPARVVGRLGGEALRWPGGEASLGEMAEAKLKPWREL